MSKKATVSIDPTCIELVRAGVITYRQLNEVHRLVQESGGSFEDILVSKGYVSKAELAKRIRPRPSAKKKTLRLTYSLDLVKLGLLTFKQLNECHREARGSKGQKNVVDIMIDKGYVTDVQLATIPKPAERLKHKKFSSSWDLFRSGAVSLKALNDCHKHVKLEAAGKSLKEALVEKGYITTAQLAEIERKKAAGELEEKSGALRSPFMEKYAKELAELPADLAEKLRREHLESEGISPEADEVEAKLVEGDLDDAVQAAETFLGGADEDSGAKTFMDFGGDEAEEAPKPRKAPEAKKKPEPKPKAEAKPKPQPPSGDQTMLGDRAAGPREDDADVEFRAARTMMGGDDESDEEDVEMRSAKTMMGADESDEEDVEMRSAKTMMGADESDEEDVEMRSAKTMMGADESDEEDVEMRSAKTMLGADEDSGEGDKDATEFRAAQTFIGAEPSDEKKETSSDPEFRAARTFVDMAEEDSAPKKGASARTFMDMGSEGEEQAAPAAAAAAEGGRTFMDVGDESKIIEKKPAAPAPERNAGSTFMDMDLDSGGAGMFGGSDGTSSGVAGPGVMLERDAGKSGFQRENTHMGEGEGATFMDLDGSPGAKTKSAALREAFDRAGKSGAGGAGAKSGTEFDRQVGGKSAAGQTSVGGQSAVSATAGTSSAGASSASGSTGSASGSKGSSTAAGTSGASATRPESASATEADEGKKKKKKKEDEDAYSHPLVGKVIGNCRIVKKLGEGGMGAVFLAEHTKLKRRSVIKIVPAHLATNKQLIKRFEREAQAAAQVKHPNIVDVYSVGEENGVHYIEMEYVDGQALDGMLKDKKILEQPECLRIIKDCCRGLAEAHKNGVVHRDIKPDNIMFTRKLQVKIADFGLARTSSEDLELTKVGQILGTPAYMSPEQCQGKPTDNRCDIYSLGATFYCMITGKRPFTGASVMEIMQKHIDQEPISPKEYNTEISAQVVKIILKMLAKKPEDRFQTSDEVIAAIDQFMKDEGTEHIAEVQAAIGTEFKIVKKLGQGGMGAVYSARTMVEGKPRVKKDEIVALKVLNREVTKEEISRFEQEAKLALEIDHENIIRVLEYKISEAVNYIVMEFVDGKSVRDIIRDEKKLDAKEAARIVREAGKGLGRAHELGIVHRDIKPDNIMIDNKTRVVKVADFGIAKHQGAQSELTQAGVVVGTPHYMSPEQCGGANRGVAITTRADIYSLGATLYFMVTGQKPFEGDTQMAIILQHLNQPPKPPHEVDEKINESFSNTILNMMSKKPEYRYATVELALKDLDTAEKGGRVKKRKRVDTPFEEQGAGRRLVLLGGGVLFAVTMLILSVTLRSDPKHKARDEMTALMTGADGEVKSLVDQKKFGEADAAVLRASDKIRSTDFTADKELFRDFEQSLGTLKSRVADRKRARDAEADALQKRFAEPWQRARGEVDTARAIIVDENDQFCSSAEHYLGTYGEALAPTYEATVETFGDSPMVKAASDARNEMLAESNRAGRERLERLKDEIRTKLEPKLYYQIAQALVGKLEQTFKTIRVPGRKEPVSLDVFAEIDAVSKGYDESEKAKLPTADLLSFRNACSDAEDLERRLRETTPKGQMVSYTRVIAAFQDAKRTIDKGSQADQARSMHVKIVRERLSELTKKRDDDAQERVDTAAAKAVEYGQEGELGKPVTAIRLLDDTYSQIKQNYDSPEAAKVYLDKLDDSRRGILKLAAQKWREKRDAVDRLAWHERSFLKAEASLREVMASAECKLELEVGGQSVTIAQLAQDEVDALKPQLQILKPVSEGGFMLEVKDQGPFSVGSDDPHHRDQGPRHEVANVRTFFIDRTEVTIQQYLRFLRTDKKTGRSLENVPTEKLQELCFLCRKHDPAESPFCSPDEPQSPTGHMPALKIFDELPTKPVAFVSYYDAYAFAKWAGKDLPSENQWEKAACWDPATKTARRFPWGDDFRRTAFVGSGPNDEWPELPQAGSKESSPDEGKSPVGALDMAGSLLEWTKDAYKAYPGSTFLDPDFAANYFVIRGGSYRDYNEAAFRGSYRFRAKPFERKPNVGFRCVREEK